MLEEIKTYVTVVQVGSFTQAAEQLGVSRSVISKKISNLETLLGVRLLNRTTRRLSQTEAGEHFYKNCRDGLTCIDEAIEEIRSLSTEPRGRLYVNLPMTFGILHVAPIIGEFIQRYPGISVDLNLEDRKVEVIEPGFDLSIRIADLEPSSLRARRLGPCHHLVVASPAYLEQNSCPQTPEDLTEKHTIASFRYQEPALEWQFEGPDSSHHRINLQANIVANNSLALREIVLSGVGIARMPTFLIGPDVVSGNLKVLLPDYSTLSKSIHAVFPRRQYMPIKTRLFLDYLSEKIADPPWWDEGIPLNE